MVLTHQALQLGLEPALRAPSRHQETISVVKMAPIKSRREERDAGNEGWRREQNANISTDGPPREFSQIS